MARPLRIEFAGALYHVTSRGDGKEAIYLGDDDRSYWLEVLRQVSERYRWVMHAYCLMGNHFHLVFETPEANLSRGMRHLNGVYTQGFNYHHQRTGHVFQGRFHSVLVDGDEYLLQLGRYVVLNPVRARLVRSASDWPWSSYQATAGLARRPTWLCVDRLLSEFSPDRRMAQLLYQDFVSARDGERSPWERLQQQIYLGSPSFVKRVQTKLPKKSDLTEIPAVQRRFAHMTLSQCSARFSEQDRAIFEAYSTGNFTMREIAIHFHMHYSSVSRIVARLEHAQRKT